MQTNVAYFPEKYKLKCLNSRISNYEDGTNFIFDVFIFK